MLNNLNQPKGSTIGILKDGTTVQEAFDKGAAYLTYKGKPVERVLKRMQTLSDWGAQLAPNGFHTILQDIWNDQVQEDIYHRGGIALGKEAFGVRMNACALSLRTSNEGYNSWNTQVTGINSNLRLAQYGSPDKVTFYADIASTTPLPGELAFVPDSYTEYGFHTTDQDVLKAAKRGVILRAGATGSTRYWNIVDRVEGTQVIGWMKWATNTTADVTPPAGTIVEVNPEGKIWAENINALWNAGGRSKSGVIAEWGVMLRDAEAAGVNGLDIVNLPGSARHADTALLIRGGGEGDDRYGWRTSGSFRGFADYGVSILYDGSSNTGAADLYLNGKSASDIRHRGNAKTYGELYTYSGGAFDSVASVAKSPTGYRIKSGNQMAVLSGAGTKTLSALGAGEYIFVPVTDMIIVCPSTDAISAGYEVMLSAVGTGGATQITIRAASAGPMVYTPDGQGNSTAWTPKRMKRYVLKWDGTNWYVLE